MDKLPTSTGVFAGFMNHQKYDTTKLDHRCSKMWIKIRVMVAFKQIMQYRSSMESRWGPIPESITILNYKVKTKLKNTYPKYNLQTRSIEFVKNSHPPLWFPNKSTTNPEDAPRARSKTRQPRRWLVRVGFFVDRYVIPMGFYRGRSTRMSQEVRKLVKR